MMQLLNLPSQNFRIKKSGEKSLIFDSIRKKFVALTPEEWVRQNFVGYLNSVLGYPQSLMAIEMPVEVNGLKQRADIVIFNRQAQPCIIVECKAPQIVLKPSVIEQAVRYNIKLRVSYLIITNGLVHLSFKLNYADGTYSCMENIPDFDTVLNQL